MKHDESYRWQQQGEDEAMFDEYRKELRVIVGNIGSLVRAHVSMSKCIISSFDFNISIFFLLFSGH